MRHAISPAQAIRNAFEFAGHAWRDAWAIQALASLGLALVFVATHARLTPDRAADLLAAGSAFSLVACVALAGALFRLGLGKAVSGSLGPGGMQIGRVELRLLGALACWIGVSLLLWLPLVAVTAAIFVLLHDQGSVFIQGVGSTPASFLVAGAVWAGAGAVYLFLSARMALVIPASVCRARVTIVDGWRMARGVEGAIVIGLLLSLAPAVLVSWSLAWLDRAAVAGWAWEDAAVVGGLVSLVLTFVQAPLTVGVLSAVYRTRATPAVQRAPRSHAFADAFRALEA